MAVKIVSETFKDGRTDKRTDKGSYYGPQLVNTKWTSDANNFNPITLQDIDDFRDHTLSAWT